MIRLALASLRFRVGAFVATLVAVLIGATLLIACGGLFETALRLDAPPQRLAAAPVVVTGPTGFALPDEDDETVAYGERTRLPAGVADTVRAVPGVAAAVPDVSFPACPTGACDGAGTTGHAWSSARLTPYALSSGRAPANDGEVVLDDATARRAHTGTGRHLSLTVEGKSAGVTVVGTARAGHPVTGGGIFFTDTDAARFAPRSGAVDAIGVLPAAGTDPAALARRLSAALPPGTGVLTGTDRGGAEFPGVTAGRLPLILLSSVFGGMVAVVMALVVAAAVSLSVRQRFRELALLRASGATPRQVHRMVVAENLIVAAFGVAGGLALGRPVGAWIFAVTAHRGVIPAALEYRQGPLPFAAGALLALLAVGVAAAVCARAAARARPVQALAEASIPAATLAPWRRLAALALGVATVGLATPALFMDPDAASAIAGPSVLTGVLAIGLAAPELLHRGLAVSTRVIRRIAGVDGVLAATGVRARAVQFAAVLVPLTLATSFALGNVYAQTSRDNAAVDHYLARFHADAVVQPGSGAVSPGLLDSVRHAPGVGAAAAFADSRGWVEKPYDGTGSDPRPILGIDAPDVIATPVTAGSLSDLRGDTAALPAGAAEEANLKVGDRITMRLGDGARAQVRIVALLDGSGSDAAVLLPTALLAPHTTAGMPTRILVRAKAGEGDSVAAAVAGRVGGADVRVGGTDLLASGYRAGLDVQAWINYLLAVLAIGYAAVASVNALAVAVLGRAQEFAALRLAGSTRRRVVRLLLIEGGILAVAALLLGAVNAAVNVIPTAIGAGGLPSGPPWVLVAVIAALVATVGPVTVAASRLAMRRRPVEAVAAPGA